MRSQWYRPSLNCELHFDAPAHSEKYRKGAARCHLLLPVLLRQAFRPSERLHCTLSHCGSRGPVRHAKVSSLRSMYCQAVTCVLRSLG
jgi:hypothetical protein